MCLSYTYILTLYTTVGLYVWLYVADAAVFVPYLLICLFTYLLINPIGPATPVGAGPIESLQ